ncbi:DNA polymerase III subunit alpha [bacterium]|nr:DNA polymerase III subunit alpha [bacterium]
MSTFTHLHVHTEYSLLESPIRVADLLDRTSEFGMSAVAMTENGSMYGVIDFYLSCKKKGIKPIVGCEMYLTTTISQKERGLNRLILLCQNYTGYQNLIQLVTIAHLEGFYYRPRIDLEHLARFSEGLIAISPGQRGPVAYNIRSHNPVEAERFARELQGIYEDRFYLGLIRHGSSMDDWIIDGSVALSQQLGIPLVATNDVYDLKPGSTELRQIVNCIQTGKRIDEETRISDDDDRYFKSSEEMATLFADIPEAITNTSKIVELCNLEIETEQVNLPRFECPRNLSSEDYLNELVWEGIQKKYGAITPELTQRVEYELSIINKMQYAPYFLIIFDFLDFCVRSNIPVGPGRGSAAGSIVAYALNITKIDPIRYNLLFERFLNPERVSMPDIDLDFCIRRRNEVIDYIVNRYGSDRVSQIITFGTMASRGVVRDVGRVLNVPLAEVDRLAKLIPSTPGQYTSIPEALEQVQDLKSAYDSSPEIKRLLDIGAQLEGLGRHTSTHAAGVVISKDPLATVVPLIKNEGQIVTQFQMSDLEKVGLLKMDILGLRNLTVLDDCVKMIEARHGVVLDLDSLPVDDEPTYDLLCTGETAGVFQLEGRGMRQLIKDLRPRVFEDIIALLALYRPGPLGSGMVNEFVSNKSGETQVKYDLPQLEPILSETYGLIVYQEQVMQIASAVGGFTLGQSDMLRRAMGKKKKEEMDRLRDEFIDGSAAREVDVDTARHIFDLCYKFAEYGFNKSHSAAYALISYQTAYLKANYRVEYMTALLSSILGLGDRTSLYIQECRSMGIPILPPDVNESGVDFTIVVTEDGKQGIRFGLGAVKNVGEGAIENIIACRETPFKDLMDFCMRVDLKQVNKRVVESLIKSGAFDQIGDRGDLLDYYESALESAQIAARERSNGQVGLFGTEELVSMPVRDVIRRGETLILSYVDRLKMEKDMLGLYISGHPLDHIQELIKKMPHNTGTLRPEDNGKKVELIGQLTDCRRIITKTKREMLIGNLEDYRGAITVMLFQSGDNFEEKAKDFVDDAIVRVAGRVRVNNNDEITLSADEVSTVDYAMHSKTVKIDLDNIDSDAILLDIRRILSQFKGYTPVCFQVGDKMILAHRKYWVSDDELCYSQLRELVGDGHFWIEQ